MKKLHALNSLNSEDFYDVQKVWPCSVALLTIIGK